MRHKSGTSIKRRLAEAAALERSEAAAADHPLDAKIITALRDDGRLTNMELGRRFGVSEASVRQRLKRLYETGAVRSNVIANFASMDLHHMALVRFRIAPGAVEALARAIAAHQMFQYVALSSGTHNVVAFAIADEVKSLSDLLDRQFRVNEAVHGIDVETVTSTAGFDSSWVFL